MNGPRHTPGDGGRPWWASGADPAEGADPDEDPLARHRAARAGAPNGAADGPGTGHGRAGDRDGSGGDTGDHRAGWWEAYDAFGRLARDLGTAAGGAGRVGHTEVCHVCPVCTALRLMGEVRPEVITHLGEAARQLTLAAKAVVDAQADTFTRDDGLQHIDLDDE